MAPSLRERLELILDSLKVAERALWLRPEIVAREIRRSRNELKHVRDWLISRPASGARKVAAALDDLEGTLKSLQKLAVAAGSTC